MLASIILFEREKKELRRRKIKYLYHSLIFAITFCLVFTAVAVPNGKAESGVSKRKTQKHSVLANIGELPNKLPKSRMELTSKRTEYSTRYLNPDGSFTEEIFMQPHFYKDPSDKKWKKIDNKLIKSTKKAGKLENTANALKATFADQSDSGNLVSVEKGGKSLSLLPEQVNKVQGVIQNNEITYKNLLQDVDVSYWVQGNSVKEDIILNQYHNINTLSFELNLNGVTPQKEKDGTIVFKDAKGNKVWYFDKPFMTDAKGKYSDKVSLDLLKENGKFFVKVLIDPKFLQDQNTKYPVTIDPTVNTWNVQRDNYISTGYPDSNASSQTYMLTGYDSYTGTTRSLVKFYLPALPSDSKIESANFNAYQTQSGTTNSAIDLYRITKDWDSTVTWNTQPTIGSQPEATTTSNAVNAYWQWDMTQLVKDWYNGNQANFGFMLKQQNESSDPYRSFNTVNNGSNTPRLTINYRVDPIGEEDFWMLTKDGINPANGNLVDKETDIDIPGRGPEVALTRTYNSRKSSYKGSFGYGWVSNFDATLVDAGSGPITYIDEDGTRHIFGEVANGGYIASSGVYLQLDKNSDKTYTITENDGTKTNFNNLGKISSIIDSNRNTTSFTYDTSGKLTKITDASGRITTISYGTNGLVSSVTDPANRTTSYSYDTSGNLIKVTNPENQSTTFGYDANHNLTSVTDARNTKTTIDYDTSDRVTAISHPITINGTAQTSKTIYAYDTTNLITSVTDGEGRRVDYTTNANGNVVQITQNPLDSAIKQSQHTIMTITII